MIKVMVGIDFGTTKTIATMRIAGEMEEMEEMEEGESEILRICVHGGEGVIYDSYAMPSKLKVIAKKEGPEFKFGEDTYGVPGLCLESLKRCLFCELAYDINSYSIIEEEKCWNKKNYHTYSEEYTWCKEGERKFEVKPYNQPYELKPSLLYIHFMEELFKRIKSELDSKLGKEGWLLDELKITFPVLLYRVGPRLGGFIQNKLSQVAKQVFGTKEGRSVQIKVVEEPTAALLSQWQIIKKIPPGYGMIIDVGGGTTDLLVYRKLNHKARIIGKDSFAKGGDDYDYVTEEIVEAMLKAKGFDRTKITGGNDEISKRAVELKEKSNEDKWNGRISFPNDKLTLDFEEADQQHLDQLFRQVSSKIIECIKGFLVTLEPSIVKKINYIFLTGGANNIKRLKQSIQGLFPRAKIKDIQTGTSSLQYFNNDSKLIAPGIGASLPIQFYEDMIQHELPVNLILLVHDQKNPHEKREWPIYNAHTRVEDIQKLEKEIKWEWIQVHLHVEDPKKFERHQLNSVSIRVKKRKAKQKLRVEYTIDYNGKTNIKISFEGKTKPIFDGYPTKTGKFF